MLGLEVVLAGHDRRAPSLRPSPGTDGRREEVRQSCPWIHKGQARGATGRNHRGETPGVSRENTSGLLEGHFGSDELETELAAQVMLRERQAGRQETWAQLQFCS